MSFCILVSTVTIMTFGYLVSLKVFHSLFSIISVLLFKTLIFIELTSICEQVLTLLLNTLRFRESVHVGRDMGLFNTCLTQNRCLL